MYIYMYQTVFSFFLYEVIMGYGGSLGEGRGFELLVVHVIIHTFNY